MSYYTGAAPNPAFMPAWTGATTTAHCFTGPSWLINIAEIIAIILAAILGAVAGGLLSWLTGGVYGAACKWVVGILGRAGGIFAGTQTEPFNAWLAAMPPHVAGALITSLVAAIVATAFLKASECSKCPPGRKAICICICSIGPMPLFPFPCGGMCTLVPAGCP